MGQTMRVSVIIVTWNAEKFIRDCLESVFLQQIDEIEVIIVDNGSTDSTLNILEDYLDRVKLIRNKINSGFCAANNQAFAKATGKFIFTLNSDIVLEPNYISQLMDCLASNPLVGMVQGKFLRMDKQTIDCLGLKLGLFFRLFNIAEGKKDSARFSGIFKIFGPCAAAALYRKKLISDITYEEEVFDPKFFFLVEDFDLAWRARNKGWKAMCVADAVCYHYRDSSAHKFGFRQYLTLRNRYYLLIKNLRLNLNSIFLIFISVLFYDLPRLFLIALVNRPALKAFSEIRADYPQLLKKRYKGTINK